ncbi:hypothetical protein PVK06_040644 [Gossypium arboreum]|uniref:Uncharacterized protein n=1 Tax=Gossypium arboreum TaxID=29729 RepID=A0ABR0N644_GOSAR|nr:hypothetical protein PVK06_040644 [Gossypium arboreum]
MHTTLKEVAYSITTNGHDDDVVEDSNLGQSLATCPRPNGLGHNLRSKTRWFTGFCNSYQVSHFTIFFIDARAEISVVESHSIYLRQKNNITEALTPRMVQRQKMCPFFHSDSLTRFALRVCSFCIEEVDLHTSPHPMGKGMKRPAAPTREGGKRRRCTCTTSDVVYNAFTGRSARQVPTMILPQVYLRKPCYDFSFL